MNRLAAVMFATAAMGFLGVTVLEPIISPALEKAAKAWVQRELGDRK